MTVKSRRCLRDATNSIGTAISPSSTLGCVDDEARFNERLKKIAKAPAKPESDDGR